MSFSRTQEPSLWSEIVKEGGDYLLVRGGGPAAVTTEGSKFSSNGKESACNAED